MARHRFVVPKTIHYGSGSLGILGEIARDVGLARVLLVTDPGLVHLGVVKEAQSLLELSGIAVEVFAGVQPDPTLENVEAGVAALQAMAADGVVALGGGSSIDCAKAIALRPMNQGPWPDYAGQEKFKAGGLPVIAAPTTAGTGSEVTRIMVLTDTATEIKLMFASRHCLAVAALVDPLLTHSMPRRLSAAVGVDALTHAIEAFVSRRAQPLTDVLALSAISRIPRALRMVCEDGGHAPAREEVMLGAMQAGMAFSNASVALVHGMARPLGACFHLMHGHSIAVLLPIVTEFSLPDARDRYAVIAKEMAVPDLVSALWQLNSDVGIPTLRQLGVQADRYELLLDKMADDALASGSPANNPRQPTKAEIIALYRRAFACG